MQTRKIETEEDYKMAMSAVQSSVELLDVYDWDDWLQKEAFFQGAGNMINPEVFQAMQKDPQWEVKVRVIRAAATYMKTIRDIRAPLGVNSNGP